MGDNSINDINDCISKAQKCEDYGEFCAALKYYNKVLSMDANHSSAKQGVARMESELAKLVYYKSKANYKLTNGRLELRQGSVVFVGENAVEMPYSIELIENPKVSLGRLGFDYEGEKNAAAFSCASAKEWVRLIKNAKEGIYPRVENQDYNTLEKYVSEHFTRSSYEEAVTYFCEMSNLSKTEAERVVGDILGVKI